ncbi:hypothetical protein DFH28DRAFT_968409 [Melampsora americana]|nr:hypothetical protein DFH28DRAFT_968409 [Melampsora americana]
MILCWNIMKDFFSLYKIFLFSNHYFSSVLGQNDFIKQSINQASHLKFDLNEMPEIEESDQALMEFNLGHTFDHLVNLDLTVGEHHSGERTSNTGILSSHHHSAFDIFTKNSNDILQLDRIYPGVVEGDHHDRILQSVLVKPNGAQNLHDQPVHCGLNNCDEVFTKPMGPKSQIPTSTESEIWAQNFLNQCDRQRDLHLYRKDSNPSLVGNCERTLANSEPNLIGYSTYKASCSRPNQLVQKSSSIPIPSIEASPYLPEPHAQSQHYLPHEPILTTDQSSLMMNRSKAIGPSKINQGSKRKHTEPQEKLMHLGEEAHPVKKKKNSVYNPSDFRKDKMKISVGIERRLTGLDPQGLDFFQHQFPDEDLGLFDFRVGSSYVSSMAHIFLPQLPSAEIGKSSDFQSLTSFSQSQKTLLIEKKLKDDYALESSEIRLLFQEIHRYSEWIADENSQEFEEFKCHFVVPWKSYFKSSLYLIGNHDLMMMGRGSPDSSTGSQIENEKDVYDRLRWMRQVQSAYQIPSSRQRLVEALVWGGYFMVSKFQTHTQAQTRISRLITKWKSIKNPMSDLGPCPQTFIVKCMKDISEMTEKTWMASETFRDSMNQLFQYSQRTGHGLNFWLELQIETSLKNEGKLNWDQQDQLAKKLIKVCKNPQRFSYQTKSWGFDSIQSRRLYNLGIQIENIQRQEQMIMDQMFEMMNLRTNMDHSNQWKLQSNKVIHARQFSNKIHMLSSISKHLIDMRFQTLGLLNQLEHTKFDLKEKKEREIWMISLRKKFIEAKGSLTK